MNGENTIEVLITWDSRRAELEEAKEAASKKVSEASEPARTARFHVTRIQAELDFYEKPGRPGNHSSGGSKADHDRLRDEITSARKNLEEAEAVEKQALGILDVAKQTLGAHLKGRPAATKDDIKAVSEKVAALREDKARVEQRLLEMEGQDDDGPIADASTSVEKAQQRIEEVAASASLSEASDDDVKRAATELSKAKDALKKARTSSASRAQAIAGLKRRLEDTEKQLSEAEAARRLAVIEFGVALHHQAVEKLNKTMLAPSFSRALSDILIVDRLLRHVRSDTSLLGGSAEIEIETGRHVHISGFDRKTIAADASAGNQATTLIAELGL